MSKHLSAKYYLENKERLQKAARERYQNRFKEKKRKRNKNMIVKVTKISQKMKNKSLLSIKKILENEKKCLIIIIRNYYLKK